MELNKKTIRNIILIVAFGVGLSWLLNNYLLVGKIFKTLWGIIFPFILGLIIAFILNIPMRAIEKHIFRGKGGKLKRPISFVLSILIFVLVIGLVLVLLIPQLVKTINMLITNFPGYIAQAEKSLQPVIAYLPELGKIIDSLNLDWKQLGEKILPVLTSGAGSFLGTAVNTAFSVVSGFTSFLIGIMFAAYLLLDKEHLSAQLQGLLQAYIPQDKYNKLLDIAKLINTTYSRFITGQFTEAIALTTVFFIALAIFRFEYSLLISVIIGLCSFIPIIGAFIGCIFGAFLILMSSGFAKAIVFVILFLVIQQLDGNFMYPKIMGNSIGLPPIWVLLAISVGGGIMGILGMLLAIPFFSVVYTLLHRHSKSMLAKKGISSPVEELHKNMPPKKERKKKNK